MLNCFCGTLGSLGNTEISSQVMFKRRIINTAAMSTTTSTSRIRYVWWRRAYLNTSLDDDNNSVTANKQWTWLFRFYDFADGQASGIDNSVSYPDGRFGTGSVSHSGVDINLVETENRWDDWGASPSLYEDIAEQQMSYAVVGAYQTNFGQADSNTASIVDPLLGNEALGYNVGITNPPYLYELEESVIGTDTSQTRQPTNFDGIDENLGYQIY